MEHAPPTSEMHPRYVGESRFVHFWPYGMLVFALIQGLTGIEFLAFGVFFAVGGVLFGLVLPWRFVVVDEGIGLWYCFGKRRFRPKSDVTVRVGSGSSVLLRAGAERFGVPLTDGLVERRRMVLRAVLAEHGFDLA